LQLAEPSVRTIEVSHDVFAAIWRAQQPGERSEEEILTRLLKVAKAPEPIAPAESGNAGFVDARFGFSVPFGFKIFRTYLGRRFEAVAENNRWLRADTRQTLATLNDLSASIGTKTENVWFHWHYTRKDGSQGRIGELRDKTTIRKRRS
jgi:hypothetical protein